jgi:hypothetical protein
MQTGLLHFTLQFVFQSTENKYPLPPNKTHYHSRSRQWVGQRCSIVHRGGLPSRQGEGARWVTSEWRPPAPTPTLNTTCTTLYMNKALLYSASSYFFFAFGILSLIFPIFSLLLPILFPLLPYLPLYLLRCSPIYFVLWSVLL